jgi:hypothetical protein
MLYCSWVRAAERVSGTGYRRTGQIPLAIDEFGQAGPTVSVEVAGVIAHFESGTDRRLHVVIGNLEDSVAC